MTEGIEYEFPNFNEADPSITFLEKRRIFSFSVDEKALREAYEIPASTKYMDLGKGI